MDISVLKEILTQSTAPFREMQVLSLVERFLIDAKIPFFYDRAGNMLVGFESEGQLKKALSKKSQVPMRIMMAHTDHPGFHGVRWLDEKTLSVKWLGGSPKKYLNYAKVWLADETGNLTEGRLQDITIASHGFSIDKAVVKLKQALPGKRRPAAKKIFGGFKFRLPFWRSGNLVYSRAADDLVGVFCVIETIKKLFQNPSRKDQRSFLGLLTRAEEVGFVGAIAHFEQGWYKKANRDVICISLEASRTLPGAQIGKGPVVRLGDRRTVFSATALQALTQLAEKHIKGNYQRRIMDGGACEGSATTMLGLQTVGISIPLGNYHNEGYEGGQDCRGPRGPAPEFVHLKDIEHMLCLCQATAFDTQVWTKPWLQPWSRLYKNYEVMKKHLNRS